MLARYVLHAYQNYSEMNAGVGQVVENVESTQ
jgi:hypothetical protein